MLITRRAEILIKADPEQIWDFVNDPAQWMASNPEEHFGTAFFTPDKKVATGGRFYQRESVAGIRADMKGHFLHVDRPNSVSWTGVAEYRLLPWLLAFRVPQSGVLRLETRADGVMMSHEMFIDVPETWFGNLVARYLTKSRNVEQRLYEHGQRELVYFKTQIERLGMQARIDESLGQEPVAHG